MMKKNISNNYFLLLYSSFLFRGLDERLSGIESVQRIEKF